jgi:hypothetical protein
MKPLFIFLSLCVFSSSVFAAKVLGVKSDKVLVDLGSEQANAGDIYTSSTSASIKLAKVKGSKAIAQVISGTPQVNEEFKRTTAASASAADPAKPAVPKKSLNSWGIAAAYLMNSFTAKPSSSTSINMTGSSFSLSGFYNYYLDKNISVRFDGLYTGLDATGTSANAICNGSSTCKIDLGYLGADALIRFTFIRNTKLEFWGGGGLGFLYALSKSSNILDTSKITINQTVNLSLGLDYNVSKTNYVPMELGYIIFPDNNTSSAAQIMIRGGWGWRF